MDATPKWANVGRGNTVRAELLAGEPGRMDEGTYRCPMQIRYWVGRHYHSAYTVAYSLLPDALATAMLLAVAATLKEEWALIRVCEELPHWQRDMADDIGPVRADDAAIAAAIVRSWGGANGDDLESLIQL